MKKKTSYYNNNNKNGSFVHFSMVKSERGKLVLRRGGGNQGNQRKTLRTRTRPINKLNLPLMPSLRIKP